MRVLESKLTTELLAEIAFTTARPPSKKLPEMMRLARLTGV